MPTATKPYIRRSPGDLVTAEDWNDVQIKIQEDIAKQVKEAVDAKTSIANADNAAKLENKTPEELAQEIVKRALAELTKVTGYRQLFKRLKLEDEKVIEHKLEACPLVDLYQLDYFEVVCSEDEQKQVLWVNFYLYHTSEKTLRFTPAGEKQKVIEIESTDEPFSRIPFYEMLVRYGVDYTETSTLDDLETEFWDKFFAKPNDRFDDDQYCHSPWFDRCCGDRRTVKELKSRGDWDEIWFKMVPRKTINYPQAGATKPPPTPLPASPAPTQIQVVHFDFNTIGLTLLADPVLQMNLPDDDAPDSVKKSIEARQELKVMVLLNAGAGVKIEKPTGQ